MPQTTSPLVAGLFAIMLAASLGCVDEVELDDFDVRAGTLLPQDPPSEPPPPPTPPDHDPPSQTKVCKSKCEACAELHKSAYECLAYDKSFDESPDPLVEFECIVCDNDGAWSAAHTCETQAKIQGVFFTDMEADGLSCGPRWHPTSVEAAY
jgi:hypothetical protein